MRIGVDYYPEHWPESRWATDAQLMREAGISVVRLAEFAWSRMEPQEGQYTFEWLDRVIGILQDQGVQVVLGTPTATPPAWLCERYPDIYPVDTRGYRRGFGTRLHRCMRNPVMRAYSRQITEQLARRYGTHPNVIGWQTDNEFEGNTCYCAVCVRQWQDWLRERYGSLEELNRAWGTVFWSQEYSAWSQVPLPVEARCGLSHNPSLQLDFRRFQSEATVTFQREQVEIIRLHSPGRFIGHNMMGVWCNSVDLHDLGRDLDLVFWDNYPGGNPDVVADPSLPHDVMRGIKQANFWVMEQQCGITGWEGMSRRPTDGQLRAWAWHAVAHGADAVCFFRWRSCLYGTEQYWHGVLNHDGVPRRRYRVVQALGTEFRALSPHIDGTVPAADVAILTSYTQAWAYEIQSQAEGLAWWDQVRRLYTPLRRLGVNVDIVPLDADLSRYRVLVLPGWYVVSEGDVCRLRRFVEAGGTLVINPRSGVKNAHNVNLTAPLPGPFAPLAGVEVDDYDPLGAATSAVELSDGARYTASVWAEALLPAPETRVEATHRHPVFDGEPAITRRDVGNGRVWYLGVCGEPSLYEALFTRILHSSGVARLEGIPEGVDAYWRTSADRRVLLLVNLTRQPQQVNVPAGGTAILGSPVVGGTADLPVEGVSVITYEVSA